MHRERQKLDENEPEILLAVRLPPDPATEENTSEENSSIDATLLSYGFEYIDASQPPEAGNQISDSEGTWSSMRSECGLTYLY